MGGVHASTAASTRGIPIGATPMSIASRTAGANTPYSSSPSNNQTVPSGSYSSSPMMIAQSSPRFGPGGSSSNSGRGVYPVSEDLRDLIRRLLKRNPLERMSFEEFFMHPCVISNRGVPVSSSASLSSSHSTSSAGTLVDGQGMAGVTPSSNSGGSPPLFGELTNRPTRAPSPSPGSPSLLRRSPSSHALHHQVLQQQHQAMIQHQQQMHHQQQQMQRGASGSVSGSHSPHLRRSQSFTHMNVSGVTHQQHGGYISQQPTTQQPAHHPSNIPPELQRHNSAPIFFGGGAPGVVAGSAGTAGTAGLGTAGAGPWSSSRRHSGGLYHHNPHQQAQQPSQQQQQPQQQQYQFGSSAPVHRYHQYQYHQHQQPQQQVMQQYHPQDRESQKDRERSRRRHTIGTSPGMVSGGPSSPLPSPIETSGLVHPGTPPNTHGFAVGTVSGGGTVLTHDEHQHAPTTTTGTSAMD
ncbi:hypothetical protein HK102_010098, partial [Quaeritorhiza haematococci]